MIVVWVAAIVIAHQFILKPKEHSYQQKEDSKVFCFIEYVVTKSNDFCKALINSHIQEQLDESKSRHNLNQNDNQLLLDHEVVSDFFLLGWVISYLNEAQAKFECRVHEFEDQRSKQGWWKCTAYSNTE